MVRTRAMTRGTAVAPRSFVFPLADLLDEISVIRTLGERVFGGL